MSLYVLLSQQALACDSGALSCTLAPQVGIPGGPNALMRGTFTNTGTTSCTVKPYPSLGPEAPSVTIVSSYTQTELAPGSSYSFDIELQVSATTDATYGKKVLFSNSPDNFPCNSAAQQWLCIIPSGEITYDSAAPPVASGFPPQGNAGWGNLLDRQTIHGWVAQLQPTTANFTGRDVREVAAEIPIDECWWIAGSDPSRPIEPAHLSGWDTVVQNNSYIGIDWVGWRNTFVNFYRGTEPSPYNVDRTPCHALVPQQMEMKCYIYPTGVFWAPYASNDQRIGNNENCSGTPSSPYVTSQRDTECTSKYWP